MEENEFLVNEVFLDTVFVEGKYTMTDVVDKLLAKGEARGEARGKGRRKARGYYSCYEGARKVYD